MSPTVFPRHFKEEGVPRASGDEPGHLLTRFRVGMCSPRERG